jgi:hypothetical protein
VLMYRYKNVSDSEQVITADGEVNPRVVEAGQETLSSVAIENPNFQFVKEEADSKPDDAGKIQAVQERNPASITGPAENDKGAKV